MSILHVIIALCLASFGAYFYVVSTINAMHRKKWLIGGLLFGPMLFPMFQISKRVAVRKAAGYNNYEFSA